MLNFSTSEINGMAVNGTGVDISFLPQFGYWINGNTFLDNKTVEESDLNSYKSIIPASKVGNNIYTLNTTTPYPTNERLIGYALNMTNVNDSGETLITALVNAGKLFFKTYGKVDGSVYSMPITLNVSALFVPAYKTLPVPPGKIKPTNSATSVLHAATDVLGVIAGTIFSQIKCFVEPLSLEIKNLITPAVVVPVVCTVTLKILLPTPLPAETFGPVQTVPNVPDPSRFVFAVEICTYSKIGCAVYCAFVAIVYSFVYIILYPYQKASSLVFLLFAAIHLHIVCIGYAPFLILLLR
jgi:hypothetical protein